MKYLITGSKGQLGKEFVSRLTEKNADFTGVDIDDIDITVRKDVRNLFKELKPDVVINCAAYNFVDQAESDRYDAFRINAEAVQILARACEKYGAFLVHYSSDYVFAGDKRTGLYTEEDKPVPLSVYGKSKLAGEKYLSEVFDNWLIFRLSWVFGRGSQNFIYKVKNWAEKNEMLSVVYDEISVPTYTENVVQATLRALEEGITGLYHLCSQGYASRYEWAKHIFKELGIEKFIYPCSILEFDLPAQRPKFSAMSASPIENLLNLKLPEWEKATSIFINKSEL